MVSVIKRSGVQVPFDREKIIHAIRCAAAAAGENIQGTELEEIAAKVYDTVAPNGVISIKAIQDIVETQLMRSNYPVIAKRFILYRKRRSDDRRKVTTQRKIFNEIIDLEPTDSNRENANIDAAAPAGMMMRFASETTRQYALDYLIQHEHAQAHRNGVLHIHDLDYYPTRSTTCTMIHLTDALASGFSTNDGSVREPQSIRAAAQLAAIILQCNQNEQHGGQAFGDFEYALGKYVAKSFARHFQHAYEILHGRPCGIPADQLQLNNTDLAQSHARLFEQAEKDTKEETYQAMEAFLHNLVTMHSRGGAQVVFSSINYGTGTTAEERMVMHALLDVTDRGAGSTGTTFIFPIQIFKVKEGINYSESDWSRAFQNWDAAMRGNIRWIAPNFDLFLKACRVSARRLFPNFLFLDAPFNKNDAWDAADPKRYMHEVCTMGCRTRVYDDLWGQKTSMGRGNLSFTTINIVRIAIKAKRKALQTYAFEQQREPYDSIRGRVEKLSLMLFFDELNDVLETVAAQLYARYQFQCRAKAKQFPFLLGQNLWTGGSALEANQHPEPVLKHGTLSIGFLGLAEALVMLVGNHHGQTPFAQQCGLEIVRHMHDFCDRATERYKLNFSLLATPAEGLSGRFVNIDRRDFGFIPGVTDREYYTNSCHIPVYYGIAAYKKIEIEAAYHPYTNGGHILYIEMDTEAKKNLLAFATIIRHMIHKGVGYGAINHEIQKCLVCGHEGTFGRLCPRCGETEMIHDLARITGYLVGDCQSRWSSHKLAEKRDRLKHKFNKQNEDIY